MSWFEVVDRSLSLTRPLLLLRERDHRKDLEERSLEEERPRRSDLAERPRIGRAILLSAYAGDYLEDFYCSDSVIKQVTYDLSIGLRFIASIITVARALLAHLVVPFFVFFLGAVVAI